MAKIAYEVPDGPAEEAVDADNITDSGKVQGIRMSKEEGKVDYTSV